MTLHSRVVAVKGMRPGEISGYGARFGAERPTTIAIIPAGYADGLDLRLAGRGSVLIRGRRAPVVGSVCMDMLTVDVPGRTASPATRSSPRIAGDDRPTSADGVQHGTIPGGIVCRIGGSSGLRG